MARAPISNSTNDCVFCRIAMGRLPDPIVFRTDQLIVFCPYAPIQLGHSLIVPQRHIPNLYALPDELAGPILQMAARVARALKQEFAADGISLRQHNDPAGGQEVFHFHLHVIPRYIGDAERINTRLPALQHAEQVEIATRLRAALLALPAEKLELEYE
jgi:histidine triad (HIT) family protein